MIHPLNFRINDIEMFDDLCISHLTGEYDPQDIEIDDSSMDRIFKFMGEKIKRLYQVFISHKAHLSLAICDKRFLRRKHSGAYLPDI